MGRIKTGIYKNCIKCNKEFYVHHYLIGSLDLKYPEPKYCSNKCRLTNKLFKNTGKTRFVKIGRIFKGTQKEYYKLHYWVRKNLGKAFWCTWCFSMVKIEWANISHQYKRNLEDWFQLCQKCHFKYDKQHLKIGGDVK